MKFERAVELVETTPTVVIDWEAVERNVERMARLASGRMVNLRPHMKTHKMNSVAALQMKNGAVGLTVAKLGEAKVMIDSGVRDLLVAYPIVGQSHVHQLLDLAAEAELTVAVDSWDVAEPIAREARRRSMTIAVEVEIDTGLHRCGVEPGTPAVELAQKIVDSKGLEFRGLMTHEGHAYASPTIEGLRDATISAGLAMKKTADELTNRGISPTVISMGSAGTARFGIGLEGVNEFRPGTYVFNDRTQVALGACDIEDCAVVVVATVVSRSQPGEAVIDAGSKVLSSDKKLTAGSDATYGEVAGDSECQIVRISEEHAILSGGRAGVLSVGDRVAIIPSHVCPVINLADRVSVIGIGDGIQDQIVDARGMSR
jgi:D-serine deaminase-like pyridoxal phosphate-dependent protein